MEEYKRFTVSLPPELYDKFEAFRKELNISRSDAIRKAMHGLMIKNLPLTSGNVVGCITMIIIHEHFNQLHQHPHDHDLDHDHSHDYSSRPVYTNVQQTDIILNNDIQHHFVDIIISTMHVHLEFEKCLEIIAVSGQYERVKKLKNALQRLKSVTSIGFFIIDKEDTLKKKE